MSGRSRWFVAGGTNDGRTCARPVRQPASAAGRCVQGGREPSTIETADIAEARSTPRPSELFCRWFAIRELPIDVLAHQVRRCEERIFARPYRTEQGRQPPGTL